MSELAEGTSDSSDASDRSSRIIRSFVLSRTIVVVRVYFVVCMY